MRRSRAREGDRDARRPDSVAKTIGSGLQVLSLFNHLAPEWAITNIAQRLDVPYSTAYRYVTTLDVEGYLVRQPSGMYRIGLPLVELAGVALNQLDVRVHGLSHLDHLADVTGLNANMAVLDQGDTFHIAYAVRSAVPRMYTALGRRAVAHCTALGKVLLADLPFEEVRSLIETYGWRPYTARSIQTAPELERAMAEVRACGYAVDRGERNVGLRCVAAPVRDRGGRAIAAISVSGPQDRVPEERLSELATTVLEHASMISYRLGYDAADPTHVLPLG
ncbi:MAG TPA: IclR family transcriptional regulator [Chloroflexota bacterium]|nr:IclR family transcriptional regulator [Chloroflexota bacterium]